jgi:predicted flap endonuclease-1-like 5' DNA nuclease
MEFLLEESLRPVDWHSFCKKAFMNNSLSTEETKAKLAEDTKRLQENAAESAQGIASDAAVLGENLKQASQNIVDDLSKIKGQIKEISRDLVNMGIAQFSESANEAGKRFSTAAEFLKARPVAVLLTGFVLGFLLAGRRFNN